jgi:tRNA-specific 2-thiouridylase
VRIRYRQAEQWAFVNPLSQTEARIEFDEFQRAAAPGQHAVVYDGENILGGGVIT